jgi:hypothetical protein
MASAPAIDYSAGRVLALHTFRGLGRSRGVSLEGEAATAFRLRDAKVLSLAFYFDRARALADLDLKE